MVDCSHLSNLNLLFAGKLNWRYVLPGEYNVKKDSESASTCKLRSKDQQAFKPGKTTFGDQRKDNLYKVLEVCYTLRGN